jgi:hypothetical protein
MEDQTELTIEYRRSAISQFGIWDVENVGKPALQRIPNLSE